MNSNWSYSPQTLNSGQNQHFFCFTLKFDGWPWKSIWHLSYTTSSFVCHFIAICEVKLDLQSGNAQFGSKLVIFLSRVTLKFDKWLWKTIGHLIYTTLSFVLHFKARGEFKLEVQSENTKFRSKSAIFLSPVTLKFEGWPWKSIGHLSYAALSFVCHFIAIGKFKLELQLGNAQIWVKIDNFFSAMWPWNLFDGWPWKTIGHLF